MPSEAKFSQPLVTRLLGRLGAGLLSVLFVALVTFIADELAPGDAVLAIAGEKARPEIVEQIRKEYGLDKPVPERFVSYVGNAIRGDFGQSYFGTREQVTDIIKRSLPITGMLATWALVVALVIGVFLGTLAALKENLWPDRLALAISTLGVTVPNFVLIPILVLIFVLKMDMLPLTWETPMRAHLVYYLVLPVVVLAARPLAVLTRLTRAAMVDTLQMQFMQFARAKGVPAGKRAIEHGLRHALPPIVTAAGTTFGYLLTGSFITETAFTIPGLGKAAIDAIKKRDTPTVMGIAIVTAILYVTVNLIVDLLQPLLDPRLRESQV
ncbi:MAG: ABC transporter permease [Fimbriimonadaceae bacterium]|nr:ABC transporter permease [Fimbriimonadaceae bacterium]